MCGIAGKVYLNSGKVNITDLTLMTSKLVHRGPDDEGFFISKDKRLGLGHRRLAIIDLTKKGHQPMEYLNRYHIVFNGEVYNFREKRASLEKEGYIFKSNSDTEVILALYDKYGRNCLRHLRGMFALAIYDEREETLFLARDRIGVKPLKYFLTDNVLIFASELKAIITQPEVKKRIDFKAIQQYLTYGYVPSPLTGFEGINKLEPGHYIFINLKNKIIEKKRYWEPIYKEKLELSENEWCNKILTTLEEATRLRMIADLEVGAFLSGGVDSSGVVATMARLSLKPVKTFNIFFEDKALSEAPYARNIANMYGTEHYELLAKPQTVEILPKLAYQYEEPLADNSTVVTFLVCELAKKYVTVTLNGDGGDENFAGYPNRYLRLKRDVDFIKWIQAIRPLAFATLRSFEQMSPNSLIKRGLNFFEKSKLPLYERFASYNQVFSSKEILNNSRGELDKINKSQNPYSIVQKCFEIFKGKDLKDAGLKFDLLYFLPDQLMAKMDIASMAYSLETRSPFLDQEMVDLACKIPFNLKVKNKETKYILKKALEKIVPKENLYRPKMGFTIPLNKWFSGKLNKYGEKILLSSKACLKDIYDQNEIKRMLKSKNGDEDFGPRLWSLMFLELWLKEYFS